MSERFEMRVDEALLTRLDEARGDVSRAAFVKRALSEKLDGLLSPRMYVPGAEFLPPEVGVSAEPPPGFPGRVVLGEPEPESSAGCPECGGEWRHPSPGVRSCMDCGLTERT